MANPWSGYNWEIVEEKRGNPFNYVTVEKSSIPKEPSIEVPDIAATQVASTH